MVVGGTNSGKLQALADELRQDGAEARAVAFDARSVKDIARSVDAVCDYFGGCDILVNAVGIHREDALLDAAEASYDSVI